MQIPIASRNKFLSKFQISVTKDDDVTLFEQLVTLKKRLTQNHRILQMANSLLNS